MNNQLAAIAFGGLNGATQIAINIITNLDLPASQKAFLFYGKHAEINRSYKNELTAKNIEYKLVEKRLHGLDWAANFKVFRQLQSIKPQNLLLASRAPIVGIVLYKLLNPGTNIISIEQQPLNQTSKKEYLQSYLGLMFFNKLVPPSTAYQEGYIEAMAPLSRLFRKKFTPIANGLPAHPGNSARQQKDAGTTILGMAGRFEEGKDFETLIRVTGQLNAANQGKYQLLIAGSGSLQDKFVQLVKELYLEDSVRFLGLLSKEEMQSHFYDKLDIYVQSSIGEAMSMSMMEAMARSLPFIGSNVRGIKEFILPENNGLLFEYGNAADLISQIRKLSNPVFAKQLAEGAARYYQDNFSLSKMVSEYAKLLK